MILAITTVGYGEITPRSFLGRLITLPLLVFGLLLIALPSFVLGREFSLVWNDMTHGEVATFHNMCFRPKINVYSSHHLGLLVLYPNLLPFIVVWPSAPH